MFLASSMARVSSQNTCLTAAKDGTANRAVADDDRCVALFKVIPVAIVSHHGFLAGEQELISLTATEHIAGDADTGGSCGNAGCTVSSADIHLGIARHVSHFATAIDVASDVGTENRTWSFIINEILPICNRITASVML